MKCNVVCIQTYPKMNQKEENLSHMETLLRKAMESHPDTQLIVFPELAVTGYQCGKNFKDLAETATINSTSVKKMSALAKEFHVHIVYGMAEKEEDILYNSQFFLDDTGVLLGTYRKVHLFDSENNYFTPGDQFKVFNTKIGRIGLFICYDAFFPEAARSLAIQGVDLLVNSTNWEKPYDYDIAKQMKHDYYTMLTERRPVVYIALMNIVSYLLFLRESFYKKIDSALFHKNAVYFLFYLFFHNIFYKFI